MSPLWKITDFRQYQEKDKKPSLKQHSIFWSFAHSSQCRSKRHFLHLNQCISRQSAIKGTSLFASLHFPMEAGMTVEASIVLPLFMFFFLNLSCVIELIRLHGNLEYAICDVGNRMALYGYVLTEQGAEVARTEEGLWEELKDVAFSYTFVKNEMVHYVGDAYLQESPMVNGVKGLQFWESELFGEGEFVEIIATYRVSPFMEMVGFAPFRMANRYYGHVWSGYEIPGTEQEDDSEIVYVTENGVVYHEDKACSYLLLSVRCVTLQEAYNSCNTNGERYTPCMRCYDEDTFVQNVYITEDGENIHHRKDCGSLRRTLFAISREEAERYRACGRCAQN